MQLTPLTPSLSQNGRGELDVASALRTISTELQSFSDAPQLDAQRLLLHVLKQREPSYLLAHSEMRLTPEQLSEITRMAEKRKTGMPLAYILGEADFYGRTFIVTPDVLIPRPDTEVLIEKTLEYIKHRHAGMTLTIADIGTGSGCIIVTLALEISSKFPVLSCKLLATDISQNALVVAKQNAAKHGVLDRIEFIEGNMLEPFAFSPPFQGGVRGGGSRKIDLIVSNSPYLPAEALAKAGRTPETRGLDFEPRIALDGGPDGLDFVRQIQASKIPSIIETIGGEIIVDTRGG